MKEIIKNATIHNKVFMVLTGISIFLIVTSFFIPPYGVVDPSVMASIGELFAFGGLWAVYKAIDQGTAHKFTSGGMSLEIKEKTKD